MRWRRNSITERLGLDAPIIQAPMASANTPELAAAVCEAGGLGSLGMGTSTLEQIRAQIEATRALTGRSLNLNFFCHPEPHIATDTAAAMRRRLQPLYAARGLGDVPPARAPYPSFGKQHLELVLEFRPQVVSFHFGLPEAVVIDRVKAAGAMVLSSATTVAEARWLEARGVDAIIAQGYEAGGHRGTFLGADIAQQAGTMALVPQIVDAVRLPVIAAGGITDARGIAAALMLGTSAVQMGTAFLRCPETSLQPAHRIALARATDDGTRLTALFTGRPARSLVNAMMQQLRDAEPEVAPYPTQLSLTTPLRQGLDDIAAGGWMSLWSGQAAALAREMPAGYLVRTLIAETDRLLGDLPDRTT